MLFSQVSEKDLEFLQCLFTKWTHSLNSWKTLQNCLSSEGYLVVSMNFTLLYATKLLPMWASALPQPDYGLEMTYTAITSGENLHVRLDLLIKFRLWGTGHRTAFQHMGAREGVSDRLAKGRTAANRRLLLELWMWLLLPVVKTTTRCSGNISSIVTYWQQLCLADVKMITAWSLLWFLFKISMTVCWNTTCYYCLKPFAVCNCHH